ncbi:hypothetical protein Ancab_035568, partial [Ancistrocladus abbreviatus]
KSREKQPTGNLQQQFNDLEQEWQSFKQSKKSKSKSLLLLRDPDYDFHTDSKTLLSFTNNSSPRNLMSSLQTKASSSSPSTTKQGLGGCCVRNECFEEELRNRRKLAIESAGSSKHFKGRKLFEEDFEGEDEVGFDGNEEISSVSSSVIGLVNAAGSNGGDYENYCENCEVGLNDFEQEEKRFLFACHQGYDDFCSNSSLTSEIGEEEEMVAKPVTMVEKVEERGGSKDLAGGYGRRSSSMGVMVSFAIILMALIFGIAQRMRGFEVEDRAFLVPT